MNIDEIVYHDALETNASAVLELGKDMLKYIAQDLVKATSAPARLS